MTAPPPTGTLPASGTWLRVGVVMFAIGFGTNVFAPMLQVYRHESGLSTASVSAMLAIYTLGLVPALVWFGPVSDRLGRRRVLRPATVVSAVGSGLLAAAAVGPQWMLYLGRFVVGIAIGMAMACGAAWIKELSTDDPGAGPRRATVAISAGFGGGSVGAGVLAQFLPAPEVTPYLVHLGVIGAAAAIMWTTPETVPERPGAIERPPLIPAAARTGRFGWAVAAWAPWVFGTVTTAFATLPDRLATGIGLPYAFTGLIGAIAMLSGMAIQPWGTRLAEQGWLPLSVVGLSTAGMGMVGAVVVLILGHAWLILPAAALLGCSYGIMMVSGLREVTQIAAPQELGALIAAFYALTYVGFFVPLVLSVVAPLLARLLAVSVDTALILCFATGAAIAMASILPVARAAGRGASNQP